MREPPDGHTPDDATERQDAPPTMMGFMDRLDAIAAKVSLVAAILPDLETFGSRPVVAACNVLTEAEDAIDALGEDLRRLPHR